MLCWFSRSWFTPRPHKFTVILPWALPYSGWICQPLVGSVGSELDLTPKTCKCCTGDWIEYRPCSNWTTLWWWLGGCMITTMTWPLHHKTTGIPLLLCAVLGKVWGTMQAECAMLALHRPQNPWVLTSNITSPPSLLSYRNEFCVVEYILILCCGAMAGYRRLFVVAVLVDSITSSLNVQHRWHVFITYTHVQGGCSFCKRVRACLESKLLSAFSYSCLFFPSFDSLCVLDKHLFFLFLWLIVM